MEYSAKVFAEHLHRTFSLRSQAGAVIELELIAVNTLQSSPKLEQFSLLMQGPSEQVQQGTYTLHNPATGELDLFLVPSSRNEKGIVYEIAFSRVRD